MMFTLNGEVLLDDSGSELAFKDFEVCGGQSFVQLSSFVLVLSLHTCILICIYLFVGM